jgi:type I restriction enzyme S subunit
MLQGVITDTDEKISSEGLTNSPAKLLPRGTLLLSIFATIGRTAVLGIDAATNQAIVGLTVKDEGRLDRSYLRRFLDFNSPKIGAQARGVAQANINTSILRDVRVPLPSFAEQRRIAEILDNADALRAKRRAALSQLDTLTQSLFLDMFGDPVTNTRSWPVKTLATLGRVERGVSKHRPRDAPELLNGPYPFIQTGDVANCDGYVRTYRTTYSEIGLRQSKMWRSGTLCITIAANIAKTGILMFDACFPDSVVGFSCNERATVEFVRIYFSFLQESLERAAPESAQKNINLEILRGLRVPTPELNQQRDFARRLRSIEELKAKQRAAIGRLDALFASLQHRAFRGEL